MGSGVATLQITAGFSFGSRLLRGGIGVLCLWGWTNFYACVCVLQLCLCVGKILQPLTSRAQNPRWISHLLLGVSPDWHVTVWYGQHGLQKL